VLVSVFYRTGPNILGPVIAIVLYIPRGEKTVLYMFTQQASTNCIYIESVDV
jgi:hypothetical protein